MLVTAPCACGGSWDGLWGFDIALCLILRSHGQRCYFPPWNCPGFHGRAQLSSRPLILPLGLLFLQRKCNHSQPAAFPIKMCWLLHPFGMFFCSYSSCFSLGQVMFIVPFLFVCRWDSRVFIPNPEVLPCMGERGKLVIPARHRRHL